MSLKRKRSRILASTVLALSVTSLTACQPEEVGGITPSGSGTPSPTSERVPPPDQAPDPGSDDRAEGGNDLKVTGVALTVFPMNLSTVKCRTAVPQSYTAVISFAEGHKGGEVTLRYGATSSMMKDETVSVPAGETSLTRTFLFSEYIISGSVAAAQVSVIKPDFAQSAVVRPVGMCNSYGYWGSSTTGGTTGGS